MTTEEALEKIKEVHGDKYTLDDDWKYINAKTVFNVYCKEHGKFEKDFYRFINLKQGCPHCIHNGVIYKKQGFWNIKENCFKEAKKYKNKWELQKKCCPCYQGLNRNGWLDEAAKLFYDDSIHYMKYDEKINTVYVYEFNELKTFYVGRTNNLKRRDKQHRNGYNHKSGNKTFDNLYKFVQKHNIEMPKPITLECNLTAIESQEKEDFWKNEYINRRMEYNK